MIVFTGWTVVACIFAIMGLVHWKSSRIRGMVNGKVPQIPENHIKQYNHAVGILYWVFSVLLEFLGLPLLLLEQNNPICLITILGTVFLVILLGVVYFRIENHFK